MLLALVLLAAPAPAAPPAGGPTAAELAAQRARVRSAMAVQRRHAGELMRIPDVVGTGVGLGPDSEPVIRVFTVRPGVQGLPATLEGVPVHVRVSGWIRAQRGATCDVSGDLACGTAERWPLPVPIGVSIGHPDITAGTIGARVTDGSQVFALSNNHVLANANLAALGDASLQPGPYDGGSAASGDSIGALFDFEPLRYCEKVFPRLDCSQTNLFDAAIALSSPAELGFATPTGEFGSVPGYGAPHRVIHPAYGDPTVLGDEDLSLLLLQPVQKVGRTTGHTHASIDTIQMEVAVCYDDSSPCRLAAHFSDQLAINVGTFSAGGDSGSLVVTDDALRQPVALLFAGSDFDTIVSRIDLVLDRFGVTIDDGGTSLPFVDAVLESLEAPSYVLLGDTATVSVVVRNAGTDPLPAFDVVLDDVTEATASTLVAPALGPGAEAQLDFTWTPTVVAPHTLTATLQLADEDPSNDQATAGVSVLLEPPGVSLRRWVGTARTDAWTLVLLDLNYGSDMVVVCTPRYDQTGLGPLVTRVRNASGNSFEVGLGRPWYGAVPGDDTAAEVHCMVVRAGVYDGSSGARMEALRLDGFTGKDDAWGWVGESRPYAQLYSQPVVVGQVISESAAAPPGEIGVWSTFWARGASAQDPPSTASLFVGRHTGEDWTARAPETLAYVVIEAGSGRIEGQAYMAGLGAESVGGVDDAPPYVYPLPSFFKATVAAVASPAGMNGVEGGWPILYGADAVQPSELHLATEEDWFIDSERSHPSEQVAYLVFGRRPRSTCGLGAELALALPLLAALRRRRRSR
jgi:hypothetical protein